MTRKKGGMAQVQVSGIKGIPGSIWGMQEFTVEGNWEVEKGARDSFG